MEHSDQNADIESLKKLRDNIRLITSRLLSNQFFVLGLRDPIMNHILEEDLKIVTGQISTYFPDDGRFHLTEASFMSTWDRSEYQSIKKQKLERGQEPVEYGHLAGYSYSRLLIAFYQFYDKLWNAVYELSEDRISRLVTKESKILTEELKDLNVWDYDFEERVLALRADFKSLKEDAITFIENWREAFGKEHADEYRDIEYALQYSILKDFYDDTAICACVLLLLSNTNFEALSIIQIKYYEWVLRRIPERFRIVTHEEILIKTVIIEMIAALELEPAGETLILRNSIRLEEYVRAIIQTADINTSEYEVFLNCIGKPKFDFKSSIAIDLWSSPMRNEAVPIINELEKEIADAILEYSTNTSIGECLLYAYLKHRKLLSAHRNILLEYKKYIPFEEDVVLSLKTQDSIYAPVVLADNLLGLFIGGVREPINENKHLSLDLITKAIALPLFTKQSEEVNLLRQRTREYQNTFAFVMHTIAEKLRGATSAIDNLVDYIHANPAIATDMLNKIVDSAKTDISYSTAWTEDFLSNYKKVVQEIEPLPSNIQAVIEEAIEGKQSRLKGVEIIRNYEHNLPSIKLSPELVSGVIAEIIDNAVTWMAGQPEKRITISVMTEGKDVGHDRWLAIKISNNGTPIEVEDRPNLFQYGYTSRENGHGLGLSLSRDLIEKHHYIAADGTRQKARLEFDPNLGETGFVIRFPLLRR